MRGLTGLTRSGRTRAVFTRNADLRRAVGDTRARSEAESVCLTRLHRGLSDRTSQRAGVLIVRDALRLSLNAAVRDSGREASAQGVPVERRVALDTADLSSRTSTDAAHRQRVDDSVLAANRGVGAVLGTAVVTGDHDGAAGAGRDRSEEGADETETRNLVHRRHDSLEAPFNQGAGSIRTCCEVRVGHNGHEGQRAEDQRFVPRSSLERPPCGDRSK